MRWLSHPEYKPLVAACVAAPKCDTTRLVFCDWLEEQGEESATQRAALIRAQVWMAQVGKCGHMKRNPDKCDYCRLDKACDGYKLALRDVLFPPPYRVRRVQRHTVKHPPRRGVFSEVNAMSAALGDEEHHLSVDTLLGFSPDNPRPAPIAYSVHRGFAEHVSGRGQDVLGALRAGHFDTHTPVTKLHLTTVPPLVVERDAPDRLFRVSLLHLPTRGIEYREKEVAMWNTHPTDRQIVLKLMKSLLPDCETTIADTAYRGESLAQYYPATRLVLTAFTSGLCPDVLYEGDYVDV